MKFQEMMFMNVITFNTVKGGYCNCMAQVVSQARIYEGQGQITSGKTDSCTTIYDGELIVAFSVHFNIKKRIQVVFNLKY